MYSLKQIRASLENLPTVSEKSVAIEKLKDAENALKGALVDMDAWTVCTRNCLDTLLGCMMAVEAIIGEDKNG